MWDSSLTVSLSVCLSLPLLFFSVSLFIYQSHHAIQHSQSSVDSWGSPQCQCSCAQARRFPLIQRSRQRAIKDPEYELCYNKEVQVLRISCNQVDLEPDFLFLQTKFIVMYLKKKKKKKRCSTFILTFSECNLDFNGLHLSNYICCSGRWLHLWRMECVGGIVSCTESPALSWNL